MLSGFFKRLLMTRQLNFTEGDVSIFEIPHVMHPANYHWQMHSIMQDRFGDKGRTAIYDCGKLAAEDVSKQLFEKFKVSGIDSINLWHNVIELGGTAKIISVSPREGGFVTVQANSAIARHMLKQSGKAAKERVDYYLCGFMAGIFSKIYSKEITCVETKCIAAGDANCEFSMKPVK
ncbi:MAG: V4R domain-containing protein [Candidatus Micrarchaeota archaeon]